MSFWNNFRDQNDHLLNVGYKTEFFWK